ncbi:MAG TPA: hypothetical protein VLV83_11005 [Acidobacteriota bacterium]|nr:hypothetical protein [Acidobacteriota bacterium]
MRFKTGIVAAAACCCLASTLNAQSREPTLEDLLKRNSYRIDEEGKLGGPGLDFLLEESRQAQFVVLGEPHNVKQVPEFTTALFKQLHSKHGFDYLALEQGPFIVEALSRAGRGQGREGVFKVAGQYPGALHFYTDQELNMIADVTAVEGGAISRVWGVDRSLSSVLPLHQLAQSVSDKDLAAQLSSLSQQAREFNLAHLLERERLMGSKPELFESLPGQAVGVGEEAAWTLRWLAGSARNIRLFREHTAENPSGYFSNLEREEMMKDAFLRQYRRAMAQGDSLPKVLIKSGHWHSLKGRNLGNIFTLGNLVSQLARSNGRESLHIGISVINEPGRHWSISEDEDWAPIAAVSSPEEWTLIDLRPLRPYLHSGLFKLSPSLEEMAFSFDLALVLGGTDAGSIEWAQALIQAAQAKDQPQDER